MGFDMLSQHDARATAMEAVGVQAAKQRHISPSPLSSVVEANQELLGRLSQVFLSLEAFNDKMVGIMNEPTMNNSKLTAASDPVHAWFDVVAAQQRDLFQIVARIEGQLTRLP